MKEFISINKQKIQFTLKWTSIVFSVVWTVFLLKKYFDSITVSFNTIITGYFVSTIILPLFTEVLISIGDLIEFNRSNKILRNNPFDHLLKIGLTNSYTDIKSKWSSSKPTMTGMIDNYPIRCEVEKGIVRIIANANLDKIDKADMKKWKELFGDKNIEYDWFGVAIVYRPKHFKQLSFIDLETELRQLIKILKKSNIEPWDI
ncbi:MAG: hypothetical protein ABIT08_14795 [Bacteroidia bacterium]